MGAQNTKPLHNTYQCIGNISVKTSSEWLQWYPASFSKASQKTDTETNQDATMHESSHLLHSVDTSDPTKQTMRKDGRSDVQRFYGCPVQTRFQWQMTPAINKITKEELTVFSLVPTVPQDQDAPDARFHPAFLDGIKVGARTRPFPQPGGSRIALYVRVSVFVAGVVTVSVGGKSGIPVC